MVASGAVAGVRRVARGGRRRAARVWRAALGRDAVPPVAARSTTVSDGVSDGVPNEASSAEAEQLLQRLRTAKGQVKRLRAQLADTEAKRAALAAELTETRHSVVQPDWTVPLAPRVGEAIAAVIEERLSYLPEHNLRALASIVAVVERDRLPGLIIECGTARGGSAIAIAAAKTTERPMRVYDVFDVIPPPTDADGPDVHARYQRILDGHAKGRGGDVYYGYRPNLYDEVTDSFTRLLAAPDTINVELVKGLFEDTIDVDEPVAFAHLDGDWYESTMTCLQRIGPHVVPGGRIVLDDYWMWSGCRTAADEYFAEHPEFHLERRTKLHAVRL